MALRFYKPVKNTIKGISFDLDDTLYFNEEVINKAEQVQYTTLCQLVPEAKQVPITYWRKLKWQVAKEIPDIAHDVSVWRKVVLEKGLTELKSSQNIPTIIEQVYSAFYQARSDFDVPQQSFDVLSKLKQKYPLFAVTNGNADFERIGLKPYFVDYYRAGERSTRMKPHPDMLNLITLQHGIAPENILHIGDSPASDIQAAVNAGCGSLWFNPDKKSYPVGYVLPTGEYSDLDDLLHLL